MRWDVMWGGTGKDRRIHGVMEGREAIVEGRHTFR